MSDTVAPDPQASLLGHESRPVLQWLAAAVLIGAGASVLATIGRFRELETAISAAIAGLITGTKTTELLSAHSFYWALGTPRAFGLIIQSDCSSSWLVGPLLVIAGLLAMARRFRAGRVMTAAVLAVVLLFTTNLLRIAIIVWATNRYGYQHGFWWSHVVVGSLFTVVGSLAALAVLLRVSVGGRSGLADGPRECEVSDASGRATDA
jgi:exosortase/archaeosortase family protein